MATRIDVWQVGADGDLTRVNCSMSDAGLNEPDDLEVWIRKRPELLGEGLLLIGEQVPAGRTEDSHGYVDFLALDEDGSVVVVELKRGEIGRSALGQAIDYASDVAEWDLDKLDEVYREYVTRHPQYGMPDSLDDAISEAFGEIEIETLSINDSQRILMVGTGVTAALERMVEWLSENFGVTINAVLFTCAQTAGGDTVLAKTTVIPEEIERERSRRARFTIAMSDAPGTYERDELKRHLISFLSKDASTPRRIREILLPLCLREGTVPRSRLQEALIEHGETSDEGAAGRIISVISKQLAIERRDYLRQVIRYDTGYPRDNYRIPEDYRDLVEEVLRDLHQQD
ncbi:MAG: hypothetical protein ACP5KN_17155 [Armatimonadota bacterium]